MGARKRVEVEVEFLGSDAVVEHPKSTFRGVLDPRLSNAFGFNLLAAREHDHGGFGPDLGAASVDGAFQVNLWGTSHDFRELARYRLAIAELDTTVDPGFHQHHDELRSDDGRTRVDVIVRKLPS